MTSYEQLPVEENAYPPSKWMRARRIDRRNIFMLVLASIGGIALLHYAALGAFPSSSYSTLYRLPPPQVEIPIPTISLVLNDTYYRDAYPVRNILKFFDQAEREIAARGLDTCDDQLGRSLIEAYHRTRMDYLRPVGHGGSEISCTPVQHDNFSDWWPVPASPCVSFGLRANERTFMQIEANITDEGIQLDDEMKSETFVGSHLEEWKGDCKEQIERTLLVIPRQDQWNPFHVGEDMVTTVVSALVAARAYPELADQPLQVVFNDGFELELNHFVTLWDKMGAWPPRRLSLDPWNQACFKTVIHSVTAGVSLLSAQGVGQAHLCASSITWAASHYYRHLFNLKSKPRAPSNQAINVLWLSRAKFDNWALSQNKWSMWRDARHIANEESVVQRLQLGLAGMCRGCFIDETVTPGYWAEPSVTPSIRFASLDPSVHSLDTQIHMVGHTSILISLHGGALGLSLYLPPGEAVVMELSVPETSTSKHFETLSSQLGLQYEMVMTEKEVDEEDLWRRVQSWVERLQAGRL